MTRIFMSAGEPSGVNIGATLMRTLKGRMENIEFVGLGGQAMVDEGLRQIFDPAKTATMWLWGNLKRIPAHRRALQESIDDWEREPPDLVVTIDYQAFHLFLGTAARERGIRVLHYVSSQFWARRYWTLEPIRRAYDHVLCIHEFEKPFYDAAGIPASFVGHPLLERLEKRTLDPLRVEIMKKNRQPRLGILPGSRRSEISGNLPVMLDAARRLDPQPFLQVSCGRPESLSLIEDLLGAQDLEASLSPLSSGEILTTSDLALITSGSASMEAVYYGCPCCITYRLGKLSYFFAKPHISTFIGQPNLIADEEIAPEFLLPSASGKPVAEAAQALLSDPQKSQAVRTRFAELKAHLLEGRPPSERAADVVEQMLR